MQLFHHHSLQLIKDRHGVYLQDNTVCKLFGQGSEQSSVFQVRNSFGIHALDKDFTQKNSPKCLRFLDWKTVPGNFQ
jgi:hypothetical protein